MKEKIKLTNECSYEISHIHKYKNLLTITFDETVDIASLLEDMSIFNTIQLLTRGDSVAGEFADFNTIYLQEENTIILSNDGSVYVPPVIDDTIIGDEDIPAYVPTLEEVINWKTNELSYICENQIISGVDVEIDGIIEHFSYKLEDQNEIADAFDLATKTGMSVPYHSDNNSCKLYTPEQITSLYIAQHTNTTHHKTYFNQMKMYIHTLTDTEVVNAVTYGDELTGKYLDNYNMIMAQATAIIQKVLGGAING